MSRLPKVFQGDKFGRWMADGHEFKRGRRLYVPVTCTCGRSEKVLLFQLSNGRSKSCGCLKREKLAQRMTTHGLSKSPEFWLWVAMRERCNNPNHPEYHNYGGRGISVCRKWLESFSDFLADVGRRPSRGYSLERLDNNGDYEPANVVWATQKQQTRNTRRNVLVEYEGKHWCFTDLAAHLGINRNTARVRMHRGKTPEQALGLV